MGAASCKANCREYGHFLHNSNDGTYCGKTCKTWRRVLCIYFTYAVAVFAAFVGGLFAMNSYVSEGVDSKIPKRKLVRANIPKLTIMPQLPQSDVMWYIKDGNGSNIVRPQFYVDMMDNYLKKYENLDSKKYVDCSTSPPGKGKYCKFTKDMLGPCSKKGYGYYEDKPCIFMRVNKMRNWVPWKARSRNQPKKDNKKRALFVGCSGLESIGIDHVGKIEMHPNSILPHFFPYDGSDDYISPLVSAQFMNLPKGIMVPVNCSIRGLYFDYKYQLEMSSQHTYLYIN